jgi:hypothetical protein
MTDLVHAAEAVALPFEASPSGRWVRFGAAESAVYVVRDAWGDGCSVLTAADEGARPGTHFLRPGDAVAAAVNLLAASEDDDWLPTSA